MDGKAQDDVMGASVGGKGSRSMPVDVSSTPESTILLPECPQPLSLADGANVSVAATVQAADHIGSLSTVLQAQDTPCNSNAMHVHVAVDVSSTANQTHGNLKTNAQGNSSHCSNGQHQEPCQEESVKTNNAKDSGYPRLKRSPRKATTDGAKQGSRLDQLSAISSDIIVIECDSNTPSSEVRAKHSVQESNDASSHASERQDTSEEQSIHTDVNARASSRNKLKRMCKPNEKYEAPASPEEDSIVFVPECVPDEALCISEGWCSICNGGDSQKSDLIVFCEECGIPVHQSCYGIPEIPQGDWFCHRCLELKDTNTPSNSVVCFLCQRYGGAMKPLRTLSPHHPAAATHSKPWVHVLCVWWDPDIVIEDMVHMEPLSMINHPLHERIQAPCCLCQRSEGWLIKCHRTHCNEYFHAICARMGEVNRIHAHRSEDQKALMVASGRGGFLQLEREDVQRLAHHAYCHRHAKSEFAIDDLCDKLLASGLITDNKVIYRLDQLRSNARDVDKFLKGVMTSLVRVAEANMVTTGETKEFHLAHLQALQLVLDHLNQIQVTYPSCTIEIQDLLPEALIEALSSMFAEGAPDPFTQCSTCENAMSRMEKVWYCENPNEPHGNHWGCLRQRKLNAPPKRKPEKRAKRSKPKPPICDEPAAVMPTFYTSTVYCGMCEYGIDMRAMISVPKDVVVAAPTVTHTLVVHAEPEKKPDVPLVKARLGPPPSDRFRVERASIMINHIVGLVKQLVIYYNRPPVPETVEDPLPKNISDRFQALLTYLKPFDGYAHDKINEVYTLFTTNSNRPGLAMLRSLVREYTRLMHSKQVKAFEKAAAEKKGKDQHDVAEFKRVERPRVEVEKATKEQILKKEKARERNSKRKATMDQTGKVAKKGRES